MRYLLVLLCFISSFAMATETTTTTREQSSSIAEMLSIHPGSIAGAFGWEFMSTLEGDLTPYKVNSSVGTKVSIEVTENYPPFSKFYAYVMPMPEEDNRYIVYKIEAVAEMPYDICKKELPNMQNILEDKYGLTEAKAGQIVKVFGDEHGQVSIDCVSNMEISYVHPGLYYAAMVLETGLSEFDPDSL